MQGSNMKYLFAGSQTPERLKLLMSQTKISSEGIESAIYDHLVRGFDVKNAALMNGVAQQDVDRAMVKVEAVAKCFEELKELDARKSVK